MCMHVCFCACWCVCVYICMHVCMYSWIYVCTSYIHVQVWLLNLHTVCVHSQNDDQYVYVYAFSKWQPICVCVCMYVGQKPIKTPHHVFVLPIVHFACNFHHWVLLTYWGFCSKMLKKWTFFETTFTINKCVPALKIENFAKKTACGEAHHCDNTIQLQ